MAQEATTEGWDYQRLCRNGNFTYIPRLGQEEDAFLEEITAHEEFVRRMPGLELQTEEYPIMVRFSPESDTTILEYVAREGSLINPKILSYEECAEVAGTPLSIFKRYELVPNSVDAQSGVWEARVLQHPGLDKPEIPFELVRVFMYGDPPKAPGSWK